MDSNSFCSAFPESSTPELPCYDSASVSSLQTLFAVVAATALLLLLS
jgi:hypothetical protein